MENHDNQQLHRIFRKKKSFYKDMETVSKRYFEFQQQVYYLPIQDINPDMIRKLDGRIDLKNNHSKKREDIYIINGQYQPTGEKSFEKLILQLVQTIPRPSQAFGIIYINTLADGEAYNDFKKILELLPIQYLVNLTKIYVLNASFFNKAFSWLSFGVAISFINKKTINVDDLRELSQQSHVQMDTLRQKLPKNVIKTLTKSQNHAHEHKHRGLCVPQAENIDKSKPIKREYISTQIVVENLTRNKSADNPASQGHKITPSKTGKSVNDYELGPTGAPVILQMLLFFFNSNQEYLQYEGLFRKSVSIEDEGKILEQLNNRNYNYLETVNEPHLIANAIKRFLCNLSVPVVPYDIFEVFMTMDSDPKFNLIVVQRIKSLPKVNRMVIFLLFDFLINKVVPHAQSSKMGVNNLCIVFGPCLMRSQLASIKDLIYAKKIIVFSVIFGDKVSQMRIKRNSYKEYRIQQMKKRESRDSKQSPARLAKQQSSSSSEPPKEEDQQPRTPTFQTVKLLNRTSLFIKQALQKVQSEDEFDEIQKEEPIQRFTVEQPINKTEPKVATVNLFYTPVVIQQPLPQIRLNPSASKNQPKGVAGRDTGHTNT